MIDFESDVDKAGNIVHGTYLENLPSIVEHGGLFPVFMLKPESKRPVGFGRKDRLWNKGGISCIELYTHPWGYRYSLSEEIMWGPPQKFHFHIVSNYPYRELGLSQEELNVGGIVPREDGYEKPWYITGNEIVLMNQVVPLETFVAAVVPSDPMIDITFKTRRSRDLFLYEGEKLNAEKIAEKIREGFEKGKKPILPIFSFSGERLI